MPQANSVSPQHLDEVDVRVASLFKYECVLVVIPDGELLVRRQDFGEAQGVDETM